MNLRAFVERRYVGSAVAFVAGVMFTFSFAPINLWPFAILMPALLMWLWQGAAPKRAGWLGFWFNAGTFSVGTYWLYISLKLIGGAPIVLALFLMAAFVSILAAYHYLVGWLVARFLPQHGALRWLIGIPAVWLLVEWLRSWFLSGFGWLALGYSQTETWLGNFAPTIGQFGIGMLVLFLAGALLTLLMGNTRERVIAGAASAGVWVAGYGAARIEWTQPFSRPITVAAIQGAVPQDEKWIGDNLNTILELYAKLTREAYGVDLIVWPESAAPAIFNDMIPYYDELYREASVHGTAMMLGALREEDGKYYNSVLAMEPRAQKPGWYDKHHLVPFTEFFPVPPFVRKWLRLMNLPYADFTHGAPDQEPLEVAGQRVSVGICYEDAYGSSQLHALESATMLVNVTNDAWFGKSSARYQHLQISRMRAMEAGRPMLRVASNGVTAAIDERGRVIAEAPEYEANVMRATIQPRTGLTPYARTGNWPVVILALVLGLLSAYLGRLRKTP